MASVELDGHSWPFRLEDSATDRHVSMTIPVTRADSTVRVHVKNDFAIGLENALPALGSASEGLRVLAESWNSSRTQLTLSVSGCAGKTYGLEVWNPSQISSVKGGTLSVVRPEQASLTVEFPARSGDSYVRQDVVLSFAAK